MSTQGERGGMRTSGSLSSSCGAELPHLCLSDGGRHEGAATHQTVAAGLFSTLPVDALCEILWKLDVREVGRVASTCVFLYSFVSLKGSSAFDTRSIGRVGFNNDYGSDTAADPVSGLQSFSEESVPQQITSVAVHAASENETNRTALDTTASVETKAGADTDEDLMSDAAGATTEEHIVVESGLRFMFPAITNNHCSVVRHARIGRWWNQLGWRQKRELDCILVSSALRSLVVDPELFLCMCNGSCCCCTSSSSSHSRGDANGLSPSRSPNPTKPLVHAGSSASSTVSPPSMASSFVSSPSCVTSDKLPAVSSHQLCHEQATFFGPSSPCRTHQAPSLSSAASIVEPSNRPQPSGSSLDVISGTNPSEHVAGPVFDSESGRNCSPVGVAFEESPGQSSLVLVSPVRQLRRMEGLTGSLLTVATESEGCEEAGESARTSDSAGSSYHRRSCLVPRLHPTIHNSSESRSVRGGHQFPACCGSPLLWPATPLAGPWGSCCARCVSPRHCVARRHLEAKLLWTLRVMLACRTTLEFVEIRMELGSRDCGAREPNIELDVRTAASDDVGRGQPRAISRRGPCHYPPLLPLSQRTFDRLVYQARLAVNATSQDHASSSNNNSALPLQFSALTKFHLSAQLFAGGYVDLLQQHCDFPNLQQFN